MPEGIVPRRAFSRRFNTLGITNVGEVQLVRRQGSNSGGQLLSQVLTFYLSAVSAESDGGTVPLSSLLFNTSELPRDTGGGRGRGGAATSKTQHGLRGRGTGTAMEQKVVTSYGTTYVREVNRDKASGREPRSELLDSDTDLQQAKKQRLYGVGWRLRSFWYETAPITNKLSSQSLACVGSGVQRV